jgi:asparagine synthase (glutamine-hydrolysing)
MCGINGIISAVPQASLGERLEQMNTQIIHRGPDADGVYVSDDQKVGMAMRRLAIIDLNTGSQPIYSEDRKKVLVFNGEIYNYKKLKAQLEEEGVVFKTTSDSEVILKLYESCGTASFKDLDGMFAFSIFDETLQKVFIVRDYFGEKPLYYTKNSTFFAWASELKSIVKILPQLPGIDKKAMQLYFSLTYIPAPHTIYEGVYKLEANNFLEINCTDLSVEQHTISQNFKKYPRLSKKEAVITTEKLVRESVASRAVADVPLGTFLSGGVDSSIVSLCLSQSHTSKIDTFSIGFEKKSFDETEKSKLVAKQIESNHHEFMVSTNDLDTDIAEILLNFDEPFADSSALPTYLVSKMTSNYVKVALTGDGGDEVFGGYNKYMMGRLNRSYTKLLPEKIHTYIAGSSLFNISSDNRDFRFKVKKFIDAVGYHPDYYFNIISLAFQQKELGYLLKSQSSTEDLFNRYKEQLRFKPGTLRYFREVDRLLSLEGDLLVKVDRTSMLQSIECRAPFLNKNLWNFTNQVPEQFLLKGWDKKHLLKEAFKEHFPKGFLDKSKKGFGVPVGDWLRHQLKDELMHFTSSEFLKTQDLFHETFIQNLVENHLTAKVDNTFRVWTFYCFQKWYAYTFKQ